MKHLLLVLTLACATSLAAEPTIVVPQFEKKAGQPAEGDPLQAKYDAAWAKYADAVGSATAKVTKALDVQFEKAADAGNLDLADMWDRKKTNFVATQTLEWPSDGKAKSEWRKAHLKVDFPDEFTEVVASAQESYGAAIDALKADYEALVKDYTKARNLARAKQVREEMAGLDKQPDAPPQRLKMVEEKPEREVQGANKKPSNRPSNDGSPSGNTKSERTPRRIGGVGSLNKTMASVREGRVFRIVPATFPEQCVALSNGQVGLVRLSDADKTSLFKITNGLADPQWSSIESVAHPGHYLRHTGFRIHLHKFSPHGVFKADATFKVLQHPVNQEAVAFQSQNFPKHFIRHSNNELWIEEGSDQAYVRDTAYVLALEDIP